MMSGESGIEKSQYWNRVLTVDMSDIVFLHCHQSGETFKHVLLCLLLILGFRNILFTSFSVYVIDYISL